MKVYVHQEESQTIDEHLAQITDAACLLTEVSEGVSKEGKKFFVVVK
jgi:hypothetical protein